MLTVNAVVEIAVTSTDGRLGDTAFAAGAGSCGSTASGAIVSFSIMERQSAHSLANDSEYSSNSGTAASLVMVTVRTVNSAGAFAPWNGLEKLTKSPGQTSPPDC
jgi:hypothetical protein